MEVCIIGRGEGWAGVDDLIGLLHLEVLTSYEVLWWAVRLILQDLGG